MTPTADIAIALGLLSAWLLGFWVGAVWGGLREQARRDS